ncbi:MAG: MerR family transcriptional regulator [Agathobacter sp.]
MKIKQVEELVGITSKNIRFYEDQGLLQPKRTENGYRDYGIAEVETLKRIKLFRKIGVPLEEIHMVFQEKKSIEDCLESSFTIDQLDSDYWLDEVEKLEKEGIDFVNVSKIDTHMKKKLGAGFGAAVMIAIMLFVLGALVYGFIIDTDFPIWALLLFATPIVVVITGILVAMKSRMKEIDKGEEDEAAKY